jgi:hypothetical protein
VNLIPESDEPSADRQQNETIVNSSAQFVVEYQQMRVRARLDAPALSDPDVRDLLQESDLFVGSFAGMGGFGILSPLECIRALALFTELFAHLYILLTLTTSVTHAGILMLSLVASFLPLVDIFAWIGLRKPQDQTPYSYTPMETKHSQKQLKMRSLVHGEAYRSEILVFGLSSWIVDSWASARRAALGLDRTINDDEPGFISSILAHVNASELSSLLQNVSRYHMPIPERRASVSDLTHPK